MTKVERLREFCALRPWAAYVLMIGLLLCALGLSYLIATVAAERHERNVEKVEEVPRGSTISIEDFYRSFEELP